MFIRIALSVTLLAACSKCFAGETVFLKSGLTLHVDSHAQADGGGFLLQMGSGTIELPALDVARIEPSTVSPVISAVSLPATKAAADARTLLRQAAEAEGVDASFVESVARIESGLHQQAVSPKGAVGLMQLMPATATRLGINAAEARENALGGARYLKSLLVQYRFNSALALAAYNAGPGAVRRYGGVPPYKETRAYVLRVTREYDRAIAEEARTRAASLRAANSSTSKD